MPARVFAQAGNAGETAAGAEAATGLFLEDHVDPTQKNKLKDILPMLREDKFADKPAQTDFETYYKTFALARWTQLGTLNSLRDYHKDLNNNLKQAKSGAVHDFLNKLVLDYMTKLAKNDYHPAVRVNAMLTIGDLNSVNSLLPAQDVPWTDAMPVLLEAVNDPKQIVPVKIAALLGVNRHVAAGANSPQIFNPMLKLVTGPDAADYSDVGQVWMRKRAVDILGLLGNLGANNQVPKLLSAYAGDSKAPFFLRLSAAEALGKLKYAGANGLNPVNLAKSLSQLMLDACDTELNTKGTSAADRQRRIKTSLGTLTDCLGPKDGSKGLVQLAKDPAQKAALGKLQDIFDALLKTLDKDISKSER